MADSKPPLEKQAPSEIIERVASAILAAITAGTEAILQETAKSAMIAHHNALAEAGYAIVPAEPTKMMLDRGQGALDYTPINRCEAQAMKVWRAMVGAAE